MVGDGDIELFKQNAYYIDNRECFEHLVEVTSGIDSQLLGDYEVSGQMKHSLKLAGDNGKLGGYFEKITNFAQSIAKTIRSETNISKGSVSVSNAAGEYIKQNVKDIQDKSILVIGAGKMGRATMRNIITELDTNEITLLNRTESVSDKIAKQLDVKSDSYSNLKSNIQSADIIIVATNADYHIITIDDVDGNKVILDLSVPKNVDEELGSFKNVDLLDLDYLSKVTNKTLENRKKFIPEAEKIIKEITEDYYLWVETRRFAPTVNALKIKLKKIQENKINILKKKTSSFDDANVKEVSEHLIQKITNQIANHLRDSDDFEEELKSIKTIFQLNHNDY